MKNLHILFLVLLAANSFSQTLTPEFEFHLYFEDAAGNKDTVTLGYDALATGGIDTDFGEVNTIEESWSSTDFQVRITDRYRNVDETFRTDKQIIKKNCDDYWAVWDYIFIDFKNAIFPVKINFDYDTFMQNECVIGSLIQTTEPNILWDATGGYTSNIQSFSTGEIIVDTAEFPGNYYFLPTSNYNANYCYYQDDDGQTIYSLWFLFSDEYLYPLNTNENFLNKNSHLVFPIPFEERFYIEGMEEITNLSIHNMLGDEIYYQNTGNAITPLIKTNGIYFISFNANGKFYTIKTIKR